MMIVVIMIGLRFQNKIQYFIVIYLVIFVDMNFRLGGPDPLDYISMYKNNGNLKRGIPPHWHYVSFGLTNLHGDGRVHE